MDLVFFSDLGSAGLFPRRHFGASVNPLRLAGPARNYSNSSGINPKPFSPAAFFSQYCFTQFSQLLPAAKARPVNAGGAISAYATGVFGLPSFGIPRTEETARVLPVL